MEPSSAAKDRLARNLGDLLHLVQSLTARGVAVEFLKERLVSLAGTLQWRCSCCLSWEPWPNSFTPVILLVGFGWWY